MLVLASYAEEGQVVLGVDVAHHGAGLLGELGHLLGNLDWVLVSVLLVHGGAEDLAVLVDDQQANDASVLLDAQNALFNFCHNKIINNCHDSNS